MRQLTASVTDVNNTRCSTFDRQDCLFSLSPISEVLFVTFSLLGVLTNKQSVAFSASLFVLFLKSVFQGGKRRREPHGSWSHSPFLHTLQTIHLIACTRVLHLGGLFYSLMYYMNEDHRSYNNNYTQLLQLRKESLKKIQACTGFEPLTSAIPMQHSDVC